MIAILGVVVFFTIGILGAYMDMRLKIKCPPLYYAMGGVASSILTASMLTLKL